MTSLPDRKATHWPSTCDIDAQSQSLMMVLNTSQRWWPNSPLLFEWSWSNESTWCRSVFAMCQNTFYHSSGVSTAIQRSRLLNCIDIVKSTFREQVFMLADVECAHPCDKLLSTGSHPRGPSLGNVHKFICPHSANRAWLLQCWSVNKWHDTSVTNVIVSVIL